MLPRRALDQGGVRHVRVGHVRRRPPGRRACRCTCRSTRPSPTSRPSPSRARSPSCSQKRHPRQVVSRMAKELRPGKVLIDWSQNDEHKTTVCVYSLRARERPTISTPLAVGGGGAGRARQARAQPQRRAAGAARSECARRRSVRAAADAWPRSCPTCRARRPPMSFDLRPRRVDPRQEPRRGPRESERRQAEEIGQRRSLRCHRRGVEERQQARAPVQTHRRERERAGRLDQTRRGDRGANSEQGARAQRRVENEVACFDERHLLGPARRSALMAVRGRRGRTR